ncbi:hypothetical protein B1B_08380, partial [mine drainage metagenome]
MKLEGRANYNDGSPRIVHPLAQQVLAKTTLLALEHVGETLERSITGTHDGTTATTVVEQGIDGFLEHALFVVDDD